MAAAVRAASLAKAPRRTVQAVAAAVTSVVVHRSVVAAPKQSGQDQTMPTSTNVAAAATAATPEALVEALREARSARRRKKRANRRARARELAAASSGDDERLPTPEREADATMEPEPADASAIAVPASDASALAMEVDEKPRDWLQSQMQLLGRKAHPPWLFAEDGSFKPCASGPNHPNNGTLTEDDGTLRVLSKADGNQFARARTQWGMYREFGRLLLRNGSYSDRCPEKWLRNADGSYTARGPKPGDDSSR